MKTLIIYDNDGYIISNITGNYRAPSGVPYIEITIPEGKRIVSGIGVNVNTEPHQAILEDIPLSETELLRDELQTTRLALAELAEAVLGGI